MPKPRSVPSYLGPVPIKYLQELKQPDGVELMGHYLSDKRLIEIRSGMHPTAERATLWHEWFHVLLNDSGVQLTEAQEEAVCDAISTGIMALGGPE